MVENISFLDLWTQWHVYDLISEDSQSDARFTSEEMR